ncbi:MAG TPA: hypothetical protein VHW09_28010 [Bryobacteraceae bacterium]|jgi:hypothetical protein|nr:hypothetical protein [Bryobacteraceae bacterium]
MMLGDLRKFAIRQQTRVRFPLTNGLECVVNEQGIAQVPELKTIPDFNLETELAGAQSFQLDTLPSDPKIPIKTRAVRREELAALTAGGPAAEAHDHDDE